MYYYIWCVLIVDRFLHTSINLWLLVATHQLTRYGETMGRKDLLWWLGHRWSIVMKKRIMLEV